MSQAANIVEKISPTGDDLGPYASFPFVGSRSQGGAYGLAFDAAGNLYVANYDGGRIEWISLWSSPWRLCCGPERPTISSVFPARRLLRTARMVCGKRSRSHVSSKAKGNASAS